jgi:hypothetical protein
MPKCIHLLALYRLFFKNYYKKGLVIGEDELYLDRFGLKKKGFLDSLESPYDQFFLLAFKEILYIQSKNKNPQIDK